VAITYFSSIAHSCSWTSLASIKSFFNGRQLNQAGMTCSVNQVMHDHEISYGSEINDAATKQSNVSLLKHLHQETK